MRRAVIGHWWLSAESWFYFRESFGVGLALFRTRLIVRDMLDSLVIPHDLAACQTLLAEQARTGSRKGSGCAGVSRGRVANERVAREKT